MRFIPKRKLRAATATVRRMPRASEDAQEPNMSFAKAIVVVVVLHLVAVGGIYAFSSLKARNIAQQNPISHPAKEMNAESAQTGETAIAPAKVSEQASQQEIQAPAKAPARPVVSEVRAPVVAKPVEQAAKPPVVAAQTARDSGALYTVAKGDNPVAIAKKLHVSYDDLLKLNKITDPKKLKIGQKLRIPVKKKLTPQA